VLLPLLLPPAPLLLPPVPAPLDEPDDEEPLWFWSELELAPLFEPDWFVFDAPAAP